jgi:hypothetical protein
MGKVPFPPTQMLMPEMLRGISTEFCPAEADAVSHFIESRCNKKV